MKRDMTCSHALAEEIQEATEMKLRQDSMLSASDIDLIVWKQDTNQKKLEEWKQRKLSEFLEFFGYVKDGDPKKNQAAPART